MRGTDRDKKRMDNMRGTDRDKKRMEECEIERDNKRARDCVCVWYSLGRRERKWLKWEYRDREVLKKEEERER